MKSISKKIYLLVVLAVMSFCAILFPMNANTARAEVSFDLEVSSAQVKVQLVADESGNKEWAIMFKSTISAEQLALAEGTEVKFGMLIGPTKLVGDNTTHAEYVADGFQSFAHVNSKDIKLEEGATGFDYYAGIKYNDEHLNTKENRLAAAKLSLTAIPFYQVGEGEIVLGTSGACQPRNILTESYVYELENEIEDNIPVTAVNNYAGEFMQYPGEAYVCKATDRLMTAYNVGDDLTPEELVFSEGDELYANGVKYDSIDAFLSADLEVNGASSMIAYKADSSYVAYIYAKHAERVITRMWKEDGASELEDYLAFNDNGTYKSIFYHKSSTDGGIKLEWYPNSNNWIIKQAWDGLYVLANDIEPIIAGNGIRVKGSQGYMIKPTENFGFIGTFDGRGKVIDFQYNQTTSTGATSKSYANNGGLFPGLNGATVKNVAIMNSYLFSATGNYPNALIAEEAYNTTFENVYTNIGTVSEFYQTYNKSLLISTAKDCVFNNVIVDANYSGYDAEEGKYTYYDDSLKGNESNASYGINADGTLKEGVGNASNTLGLMQGYPTNGLFGPVDYYLSSTVTGENFFAVGSNPMFIYVPNTNASLSADFASVNMTINMMVSETLQYNVNAGVEGAEVELAPCDDRWGSAYTLSQFIGTPYEEVARDCFAYADMWMRCKQSSYRMDAILNSGREITIDFFTNKGLYDMRNADQFANWIKDEANAEKLAKFDSAYWVVDTENGTITWKGLAD